MKDLERYMTDNAELFDSNPIPNGSKERFMARIRYEQRRRRFMTASITGIAASAAILTGILLQEPDLSREVWKHHVRLAEKETEIMMMVEKSYPDEKEYFTNTIRAITSEAIALEEQLPEYLPEKEQSRILNEYYKSKHDALEDIYKLFL